MLRRKPRGEAAASILPGYSDLSEIGGGAFATVYRAIEDATGRAVALKILKLDTLHSHLLETFTLEIQALGQVSDHPNIVTLYRPLSTPDGRPVLVLELCRESLAERVRQAGVLDATAACRIGIKISGALETAHRNGFLHRDMKPQNILVTQFGEPALADFGVAALQASAQATAGVFGFTTLHAAPEMLEGHVLSPATDIYGLASTMYQLLTGLAPFAAFDNEAPASVILRIIRDPVRPLRSDLIPLALSDLLEASLAKDPEGRPASAVEFARALQEVEESSGWPVTEYTVWGTGEGEIPRPRIAPAAGPAPFAQAPLYGDAPSTTIEVASARSLELGRIEGTPAPVASSPLQSAARDEATLHPEAASAARPPPAVEPPHRPADNRPTSESPESYLPLAEGPPPHTPPPPPPVRRGPAVAPPEVVDRNVVAPEETQRGSSKVTSAPLEPLNPLPPVERPVFVDPEPGEHPDRAAGYDAGGTSASAPRASVYEETMQVGRLFGRDHDRPEDAAAGSAPRRGLGGIPALAIAGVVAGVVVVVAAILLVLGVL